MNPTFTDCWRCLVRSRAALSVFVLVLVLLISAVCWIYLLYSTLEIASLCSGWRIVIGATGIALWVVEIGWFAAIWPQLNAFFRFVSQNRLQSNIEEEDELGRRGEIEDTISPLLPVRNSESKYFKLNWPSKKLKNVLFRVLWIIWFIFSALTVVCSLFLFFWVAYVRNRTTPVLDGKFSLPGLKNAVEIRWDSDSMIHIFAQDSKDLFFAQGAISAQTRLWQMEFQRAVGKGKLAEMVGNQALESDRVFRTFGFEALAKSSYLALPEEMKRILQSYCSGVNAFIQEYSPLPFEMVLLGITPQFWNPWDPLIWLKVLDFQLAGNFQLEALRFRLSRKRNLSIEEINELIPSYDSVNFPTALSASDLQNDKSFYSNQKFDFQSNATLKENKFTIDSFKLKFGILDSVLSFLVQRLSLNWKNNSVSFNGWISRWSQRFRHDGSQRMKAMSNNWVIGGSRTKSGKPILANDPHLDFTSPIIWQLVHLKSSLEDFDVVGATFAGLPGILLGRNGRISWGATNTGADVQDLYILKTNPLNSSEYFLNGSWVAFDSVTEVLSSSDDASENIIIRHSVYGPVVYSGAETTGKHIGLKRNEVLALRWTALDPNDLSFMGIILMSRAKNWKEFIDAQAYLEGPVQNWVYSDVDGNIGYNMAGRIPIRPKHLNGILPVHGFNYSESKWKSLIPYGELPRVFNPSSDYIVTANNKITPDSFPYLITEDWDSLDEGYRAKRITQLIEEARENNVPLGLDDMIRIQLDQTSLLAKDFMPIISALDVSNDIAARDWKNRLLNWSLSTKANSEEAVIFEMWYSELSRMARSKVNMSHWDHPTFILNTLKKSIRNSIETKAPEPLCSRYGKHGYCIEFAARAFLKTVQVYGGSKLRWGKHVHLAHFSHPVLEGTPMECFVCRKVSHGGDHSTVNVGIYSLSDPKKKQSFGSSLRFIVDMGNLSNSVIIIPMGQSGNVWSPYFADLLSLWTEGKYIPMRLSSLMQLDAVPENLDQIARFVPLES